jgi:alginate production protein
MVFMVKAALFLLLTGLWGLWGLCTPVFASEFQSQFKLPSLSEGGLKAVLPQRLSYQYGYGSESEFGYIRNADLNDRIRDNLSTIKPQAMGYFVYRPSDWLEMEVALAAEREYALGELHQTFLPDGEIQYRPRRKAFLYVDQAYFKIHNVIRPFEVAIGRQNFEDGRHSLYDTSMDVISISLRGKIQASLSAGREILVDMDTSHEKPDRIDTGMLYIDYRGIENIILAGYGVVRSDQNRHPLDGEGRPRLMGIRSFGAPTMNFRYWTDLGFVGGRDVLARRIEAYGADAGATYRAEGLPWNPYVTLAFAYGSGDDPKSEKNNDFRQTGLQSNEVRIGGIPEMKRYGEALDPDLSNLRIITAGLGFYLGPDISLDLVYHRYHLNHIAEEVRNQALTALMNQSRRNHTLDVGGALDVGIGVRNLFGLRKLGIDVRAGLFFPGSAFRNNPPSRVNENLLLATDKGISVLTKFWW